MKLNVLSDVTHTVLNKSWLTEEFTKKIWSPDVAGFDGDNFFSKVRHKKLNIASLLMRKREGLHIKN